MNNWYKKLNRSKLSPPSWVFGIVWPILYLLMTISFIIVQRNKKCFPFCSPLVFFIIQLGFNLIWTTLFFKMKLPLLALVDLMLTIIFTFITYYQFHSISKLGSYLLLPYMMWMCFAFYLNLHIVIYN
jgi:tryptophan-rich sensory protein